MFKRKKKKTGCQTPEFRKPTPPPPIPNFGWQPTKSSGTTPPSPPTSGSNAVKPNQNYILPNNIKVITDTCPLLTPCCWCTKWDKKCDKKIGGYPTIAEPVRTKVESNEGLSCYKCKHHDSISSVCSDCHPIFKNFEAKEN